ncbi:maleylpyruvate isomerase family mycothiol-dependent enzyme [Microlunatus parietis]|uniref:Maleylpyruvate isomerase n=1 Tax=Microlunatus parietis TaxID=682979 RepID=A0A7Y9IDW7_9ACTN|nr:maleylpyruvate isomerase family mycothiol-dependent enzyme [Microlunatus parietis]NYE74980.1 maleylpyruvate isomerase [Microlunatus parietis]
MTSAGTAGDPAADQLETLRGLLSAATARLLGDTIAVTDEDWRAPSRLPGWTRGHVATHIARQADALGRLLSGAASGTPGTMYASDEERNAEIEAGAGRSGLDLQIDLDTAAEQLWERMEEVDAAGKWGESVALRGGGTAPARLLPLARLTEVVLHHVDLDVGYEIDQVDETVAGWILEWCSLRLRTRDGFPSLSLIVDGGTTVAVGSAGETREVRGTAAALLGWLTGRSSADRVNGAEGLTLPAF